jgi:tetratricopeptide (TPR) repeat protein
MVLTVGILPAWASPLSGTEEALIWVYREARKVDAVRVDIERFALHHKGNHGFWEEQIGEDLKVLRSDRDMTMSSPLPEGFQLLQGSFVSAEEALEAYANAFLNAGAKEAEEAEELSARRYGRFREKLEAAAASAIVPPDLVEDFDPLDEEFKAFADNEGREKFRRAAFLLEEKKFDEALSALTELRQKYRGTPAEGSIVLRMVRCAIKDNAGTVPADQEEAQIKLLAELIGSRVYYPNCYDIYVEWRALYQGFYYGIAPDVEIPNLQYLGKRDEMISTVKRRVEADPKDQWARSQLWMLVRLPVVERGSSVAAGAGADLFGTE